MPPPDSSRSLHHWGDAGGVSAGRSPETRPTGLAWTAIGVPRGRSARRPGVFDRGLMHAVMSPMGAWGPWRQRGEGVATSDRCAAQPVSPSLAWVMIRAGP